MELYQKKINMINKNNNKRVYNNRLFPKENTLPERLNKSVYLQRILKKNAPYVKKDLNLSNQNYNKVFSNVENLFINDNTKKKAIKYVIQIGKTKQIRPNLNNNIYQVINYQQKKYKTIENDLQNKENLEETPLDMDMDLSLSDEEDNNINLNYTEREKMRQIRESNNRLSKSLEKRSRRKNDISNISFNNRRINKENEELLRIIDELQEMNKKLRKDNNKKNNEIDALKREFDNIQKELDEK